MSATIDIASLSTQDAGQAVLAFVSDASSIETLRLGLQGFSGGIDLRRGSIRQAIKHLEKEAPPHAVVVDVSDVENAQAALDDLARVCPPDVQVFVVGDNTDITFYRMLVDDVGVTEYLPKPLTRDNVQRQLLQRLTPAAQDHGAPRGGQVIAVCGARGGAGATTVAVGMAMELASVAKGHVALLDLHLQGGAVALMLAGSPGVGLRLALEDADRADVVSLRDAKAIRGWVAGMTGSNRTITVLNHADAKGGLNRKLMEKGLGAAPDIVIPELGRKMVEAVNLGVPAVRHVPALRRHLAALVREVGGVTPAGGAGSLLRRMFGG